MCPVKNQCFPLPVDFPLDYPVMDNGLQHKFKEE